MSQQNPPLVVEMSRKAELLETKSDPLMPGRIGPSKTTGDGPLSFATGAVYFCQGKVICTPNTTRRVFLPPVDPNGPIKIKLDNVKLDPAILHQPLWWCEETAYLAFVSLAPKYTGLRARHSLPPYRDPMELVMEEITWGDRRGFGLEPWRKLSWHSLERRLLWMVDSMRIKYSLPPVHQVVTDTLRLKSFYDTRHALMWSANRALKWFSAVAAQMSWAIAHAVTMDEEVHSAVEGVGPTDVDTTIRPSWLDKLSTVSNTYWDETMLQAVRKCMGAFGPQYPRTGVFINIVNPPRFQYSIDWLVRMNIPVYYIWDAAAIAAAKTDPQLQRLEPPSSFFQDVSTSRQNVVDLHLSPSLPAVPPSSDSASQPLSTPLEGNSASPLQSWLDFASERSAATERRIASESKKDKQVRIARQQNPPTVNTRVFVWDDDDNGGFSRVLQRKVDNYDVLASFRPSHKLYNACFNEWDCAYDFVVNDSVPDDGVDSDSDYDGEDYYSGPITADLGNSMSEPSPSFARDADGRDVASRDMLALFQEFFGYVAPLDAPQQRPHAHDVGADTMIVYLRNFVGMTRDESAQVSPEILHDLRSFTSKILVHTDKSIPVSGPVDSWDLVFGNRQYLGGSSRVRFLSCVEGANGTSYFMFSFGVQRTQEWNLAVCSPIAALFVCRLDSTYSEHRIGLELIRRGIPFHTLVSVPKLRAVLPTTLPVDVLPADYAFTREDYRQYIDFRTDLLNNSRVCRAALMRGGIIWRLSLSHAHASEESSLLGPTKYVHEQGISIAFNGGSLQDDCITEQELNVICGAYQCLTGKGLQQVTKSWWPPYSIWVQCYDYDFWTHAMEARFRERLLALDAGTALPMTKQQWRSWVRGSKVTRDAKVCIFNASVDFLRRELSRSQ